MALKLGELVAFLKLDNKQFEAGLVKSKAEMKAAGVGMGRDADAIGKAIGAALAAGGTAGAEGFTRDAAGRLRNSRGRFVTAGEDAGKGLGEGLTQGAETGFSDTRSWVARAFDTLGSTSAVTAARVAMSWITGSSQTRSRLAADIDASKKKLRELAEEYGRTGDKSLLKDMSRERSQIKQFETALDGLARTGLAAVIGGFQSAWSSVSSFAGTVASFASSLWGLVVVLAAVGAVVVFLLPLLTLLGATLGAIPAITTGGLAAVAALGLGFMGLSQAFQKTASAGGSVVDKAHQVAMAERRVRDANIEVLASEKALSDARKTAAERMEDQARSLSGAKLDEESAVAAVASAERDLAAARLTEDPNRIAAADLALRQQQQALADVRDRVEDLTVEQADNAQKGVEGSDEVTAALDRQRKATEGVTDAQYDLRQAQKSTPGGGAAAQVTKLSPAALAAVAAIKSLKPAFESLRLDVQEKLFAGVGTEILLLANAWLPTLHERLGGMASMFNGLFKSWAETSRKPEFIANIAAGWKSIERLIDRVGKAIVGPGLEAFGKLSRAAGPFIDALGDGIAGIVEDFAKWIDKSEKSGALSKFFEDAGKFLTDVIGIGKDVGSILGSIISILFKMEDSHPEDTQIGRFRLVMDKLADWFKDPANQKTIADFFGKMEDFFFWVANTAIPTIKEWSDKLQGWADKLDGWAEKAGAFKDKVVGAVDAVTRAVTLLKLGIGLAAIGMWDGIKENFKTVMNWIIGKWNSLHFSLPSGEFLGIKVTGGTLSVPPITPLAKGGFIPATPGGRIVRMAEAGQDEIASPVDMMRRIVAEELARVQGDQPGVIENHIHIGDEVTRVVRTEIGSSNRALKRKVTAGSGAR